MYRPAWSRCCHCACDRVLQWFTGPVRRTINASVEGGNGCFTLNLPHVFLLWVTSLHKQKCLAVKSLVVYFAQSSEAHPVFRVGIFDDATAGLKWRLVREQNSNLSCLISESIIRLFWQMSCDSFITFGFFNFSSSHLHERVSLYWPLRALC